MFKMRKHTQVTCSSKMLTASFDTANPPLLWRFDLERNHSFTLALQGDNGDWELGLTSIKGEFYSVAHFTAREDAEEAFGKIERALATKRGMGAQIVRALLWLGLGVVVIGGGVIGFGLSINHSPRSTPVLSSDSASSSSVHSVAPDAEGVPQSADDVLKPPSP